MRARQAAVRGECHQQDEKREQQAEPPDCLPDSRIRPQGAGTLPPKGTFPLHQPHTVLHCPPQTAPPTSPHFAHPPTHPPTRPPTHLADESDVWVGDAPRRLDSLEHVIIAGSLLPHEVGNGQGGGARHALGAVHQHAARAARGRRRSLQQQFSAAQWAGWAQGVLRAGRRAVLQELCVAYAVVHHAQHMHSSGATASWLQLAHLDEVKHIVQDAQHVLPGRICSSRRGRRHHRSGRNTCRQQGAAGDS